MEYVVKIVTAGAEWVVGRHADGDAAVKLAIDALCADHAPLAGRFCSTFYALADAVADAVAGACLTIDLEN